MVLTSACPFIDSNVNMSLTGSNNNSLRLYSLVLKLYRDRAYNTDKSAKTLGAVTRVEVGVGWGWGRGMEKGWGRWGRGGGN